MDFSFSEEQLLVQRTAREFAQGPLAANSAAADRHQGMDAYVANLRRLTELGFMSMLVDPEWGGAGADAVSYVLAVAEVGRECGSTGSAMSVNNLTASLLNQYASDEQKRRYLQPLCRGEKPIGSFCLTESGAGSNPAQMRATATPATRGNRPGWELNGTKQWITNAEIADFFVVWARSDPDPAAKGISCFLVDRDSEGLSLGPHAEKMGQRGNHTNDVTMQDCFVPEENLVGEAHRGFRYALGGLAGGRLGIAALALGIAEGALDYASRYVLEREQFGKRLVDHQGLQWMLAECHTEIEGARLLLHKAAWLHDAGQPFAKLASMAKLQCTERGNQVCYKALQMLGGYGYMREFPLERAARDIRLTSIYEGTSEIQKLIIGRCLIEELERQI